MTPDMLPPRIAAKIRCAPSGCWIWLAALQSNGYGSVGYQSKIYLSHRLTYTLLVGPIAPGLQADHLCRVRRCCNPMHIDPCTASVNLSRIPNGQSSRTRCPQGHPYSGANLFMKRGSRQCRECNRSYQRAHRLAQGAYPKDIEALTPTTARSER